MPRDRVFFNYSYFDNTPLGRGGIGVNRFVPGFEKTFFDEKMSFEMRFPFASTLDSDVVADGMTNTDEVEFGNIMMSLKALLYTNSDLAVAAGLAMTVPTANDVRVGLADGTDLLRIDNESVHLAPYLGALYTPGERFFAQGFVQVDVDANGNSVGLNNVIYETGMQHVGTVSDQTFLYVDVGVGYWLYLNESSSGRLTGFAPTAELHVNRSLQDTDVINSGAYQIGLPADDIQVVNGILGGTFLFDDNKTVSVAYVVPMGFGSDQPFDGELRISLDWFFGRRDLRTVSAF
jgi:hypothetical protein